MTAEEKKDSPSNAAQQGTSICDIARRYIRLGRIGKGAFKEVYRAIDEQEGLEVAWNEIDLYLCTDATKVLREVELLQKMKHSNVIRCFASWEDTDRHALVFVTELMTSGTLTDFIAQQSTKKMKRHAMLKFSRQILSGLAYLHREGVIHRDIKCSNVFVNGNKGEVKIGDLGVSIASRAATTVTGTPEYMAPEMFGENYTNAVDVWSFGLCMLEMMTGRKPYSECDNVGQIYKKVSKGTLPTIDCDDAQNQDIVDTIRKCLSMEPEQRPTAEQMLHWEMFRGTDDDAADVLSERSTIENESIVLSKLDAADVNGALLLGQHDHNGIMLWLQSAPLPIRADVVSFAVSRGWIDARDERRILHSGPSSPGAHAPLDAPVVVVDQNLLAKETLPPSPATATTSVALQLPAAWTKPNTLQPSGNAPTTTTGGLASGMVSSFDLLDAHFAPADLATYGGVAATVLTSINTMSSCASFNNNHTNLNGSGVHVAVPPVNSNNSTVSHSVFVGTAHSPVMPQQSPSSFADDPAKKADHQGDDDIIQLVAVTGGVANHTVSSGPPSFHQLLSDGGSVAPPGIEVTGLDGSQNVTDGSRPQPLTQKKSFLFDDQDPDEKRRKAAQSEQKLLAEMSLFMSHQGGVSATGTTAAPSNATQHRASLVEGQQQSPSQPLM